MFRQPAKVFGIMLALKINDNFNKRFFLEIDL